MTPNELSFSQILTWIKDLTISGGLIFILLGGRNKWWTWGWQYEEEKLRTLKAEKRALYWQDFALSMLSANEHMVKRLPIPSSQEDGREER